MRVISTIHCFTSVTFRPCDISNHFFFFALLECSARDQHVRNGKVVFLVYRFYIMEKSRCLNEQEILLFRTQPCVHKALKRECVNGDDCSHSHCVSWCRRSPSEYSYSPNLCPFVIFRQEQNRTRVKNFCNLGRSCPYSHTKEEQMYHPVVYKTKICRAWPNCKRVYCPFGMETS